MRPVSSAAPPQQSIRRRLLVLLVSVLLLLVASASAITYWVALRSANDAYDRSLLDPALDLQQNIRIDNGILSLDLPPKAQEALMYDRVDDVVFQIRGPDGVVIAGVDDLPAALDLTRGKHEFYDTTLHGMDFRVAALLNDQNVLVQVGETRHKRNRLVGEILFAELIPTSLIALITIALAWAAVAHGLSPLARVREELLRRSPQDLRPIESDIAPIEIAPVVDAFNRLLGRLRDASAMQQRFLANAAHQLRTPLAGLQMHLELLLRREQSSDIRSDLERLHKATLRSGHMTNQLLALAKAESTPGIEPRLQPVDLYQCAEAAAQQWVPTAIARSIDLGFSLEHNVVPGDPVLLAALLDNLIDNALRYTPPGGAVTVNCGVRQDIPYLSVEDTGAGIPDADRINVLERFYRVAGTQGEGSGLGLAIVKEIADKHRARVGIETPANGRGTRVVVLFESMVQRGARGS
jgi:two-component system, OmpR family, sensor histidine kinase TctE